MFAPTAIVWEDQTSDFIDRLVDLDITYLDVQIAIEHLIHAGLHDAITVSIEVDDKTVHWHRMPPLVPTVRALDIFTTIEQNGAIRVLHIRFAPEA